MKKVLHKIFFCSLNSILFTCSFLAFEKPAAKPFAIKINENVKVFLGQVDNRTKKNIRITNTLGSRMKISENIAHDENELLNKEIVLEPSQKNQNMLEADFNINIPDKYPYLELLVLYDIPKKQIKAQFTLKKNESALSAPLGSGLHVIDLKKNDQGANVYIDLRIAGENLGQSLIASRLESNPVPSLIEQSIKKVAEEIKAKKITLQKAKETLPIEMYQALENYLEKNK